MSSQGSDSVNRDLNAIVVDHVTRTLWALPPAILLVVASLWNDLPRSWLLGWAALAGIDVVRTYLGTLDNKRRSASPQPDTAFVRRNTPHFASFGLVWGTLPLICRLQGTERSVWLSLIVVMAVLALIVFVTATSRPLFIVTLAALMSPAVFGMLIGEFPSGWLVALVSLLLGALSSLHNALHLALRQNLTVANDNRELADSLARTLGHHDPLTGLLNRDGLRSRVVQPMIGLNSNQHIVVGVGNVARLAAINELFGVANADQALKTIGNRIKAAAGTEHAVARGAGDEFVVVRAIGTDANADVAECRSVLIGATNEPIELDRQTMIASLSIATVVGQRDRLDELIAQASGIVREERVMRAKSTLTIDIPLDDRRTLLKEVRPALAAGEIVPWFQPIISCETSAIVGWEALVRWEHAEHGVLTPNRFLGLIAIDGLTTKMTDAVIVASARFARQLHDMFDSIEPVHINLSAIDIRRPDLPKFLRDVIATHGIGPTALAVELTEQDVLAFDLDLMENLWQLRDMGIGIAIDDFGTGYSSLSHLLDVPANTLKIDKRFVDGLPYDHASQTLVRAMIGLADNLGLQTVAEGVEEEAQTAFLRSSGCTALQGYSISRALSGPTAIVFAEHRRATPVK